MYEPHLLDHASSQHRASLDRDGDATSILAELDRIAPASMRSFDAFPKVQSTYTVQSRRGGVLTWIVGSLIFLLVLNDLGEYLYGAPDYEFRVDHDIERNLQLNVDILVAMPCQYLTIDLRDAVGDRLHLSDALSKDGTIFELGKAKSSGSASRSSVAHVITSARRKTPTQYKAFSGIRRLFTSRPAQQFHSAYRPTPNRQDDGPACRIYGSVKVKKTTGNLHVTTLGHGYMSYEHTDHSVMNLTHVIHEFSFGPFFPAISQPLDMSYAVTDQPFSIFQYFLRVVPTTYIDASRRRLSTSQYAVTDYTRSFEHGGGVPGLFFKYDLEGMSLTIRERTTTLYQFLIRLAGVIGGVWTVAGYGLRVLNRAHREMRKTKGERAPSLLPAGGKDVLFSYE